MFFSVLRCKESLRPLILVSACVLFPSLCFYHWTGKHETWMLKLLHPVFIYASHSIPMLFGMRISACELRQLLELQLFINLYFILALSAPDGDGGTVQFFYLLLRDHLPHTIQTTWGRGTGVLRDQTEQRLTDLWARSDRGELRGSWW